jgi:inosine-uridine nucleoside N-ribohydrolase
MLHDPLTVAATVERSFLSIERMPVTVAVHEGHVRTFVDPIEGHEAEVATAVDADAFAEWWLTAVLG